MKAARFMGNKRFTVSEMPTPHAGPGELALRNKICGVCGTDVHIYHGEPGSAAVTPPVVLGHEYSAEVVEVGGGCHWLFRRRPRYGGSQYLLRPLHLLSKWKEAAV